MAILIWDFKIAMFALKIDRIFWQCLLKQEDWHKFNVKIMCEFKEQ